MLHSFLAVLSLVVASQWSSGTARGQIRIPSEAGAETADVGDRIERGERLERERRWSDAVAFYEDSLKAHPGRRELEDRLTRARSFVDVKRRYADSSFVASLRAATEQGTLDEYSEVLMKIQTYHVTAPDWSRIVRRGMTQLHYALDSVEFREANLPEVQQAGVNEFRDWLHRSIETRSITNRRDARNVVYSIADMAQRKLGLARVPVIVEFTCGATASLDRYSSFLTASQLDELFSQIEGNFVGLGVELRAADTQLEIVNVIPNSPAALGGIRKGDRIVQVDGVSTTDVSLDEAADMLKGPEGSQVQVAVAGADGDSREVTMVRRRVDIPSVEDVRIVDDRHGIAYLKLSSFQKTTYGEMKDALWQLYRDGMKSLIVDVRGNPGGLLNASVEVADLFIPGGSIVSTRGRSPREDFDHKAHSVGTWRVPLIVLIDHDTASASEIFAAAINDHRRGEIVGEQSYGKGSVQGIFPLTVSKAGVRLTTAKFYSPKGRPISEQGVLPSVPIRHVAKPPVSDAADRVAPRMVAEAEDPVMEAGLRLARERLSSKQETLTSK